MSKNLDYQTVKNLKVAGRYTDALVRGLHIWVKPSLRKYWIFRYTLGGKPIAADMTKDGYRVLYTRQTDASTMQMLMNLCFKAQNQSRATIDSLIQLKQPSQTTFVKQANIANGHQQVNNQVLTEKIIDSQNKLKGADYAELDYGRATKTKRSNKKMEALAKVHRSKDR